MAAGAGSDDACGVACAEWSVGLGAAAEAEAEEAVE